jgi:hypothetical protein
LKTPGHRRLIDRGAALVEPLAAGEIPLVLLPVFRELDLGSTLQARDVDVPTNAGDCDERTSSATS